MLLTVICRSVATGIATFDNGIYAAYPRVSVTYTKASATPPFTVADTYQLAIDDDTNGPDAALLVMAGSPDSRVFLTDNTAGAALATTDLAGAPYPNSGMRITSGGVGTFAAGTKIVILISWPYTGVIPPGLWSDGASRYEIGMSLDKAVA
jgi:hypothetical protein